MSQLILIQPLSVAEALLLVGIYRYARERAQRGELLTKLAADKIAMIARIVGIHAERLPSELGPRPGDVWWNTEVLRQAARIVERERYWQQLRQLETALQGLSVIDVEGYNEGESELVEATAPKENTGVYVIGRRAGGA